MSGRESHFRRRLRTVLGLWALLLAVASAGVWALAPLESPGLDWGDLTAPLPRVDGGQVALDVSAFRAPLWVAPPAPPPPEPPAPVASAPPPFRMRLLAVVEDAGGQRALFYDPDRDAILSVAEGQSLAQAATLEKITASGVLIRDGQTLRTLALRDDGKGAGP